MTLQKGMNGPAVTTLQRALAVKGFTPGTIDGQFGPSTESAVIAFQNDQGLQPDGIAGPRTQTALGLAVASPASRVPGVTVDMAARIVPGAPRPNIEDNLPHVLNGLAGLNLADKSMISMALATIRAETGGFAAISEGKSQFNTAPGGPDFGLYDSRADLGNQGPPDGASFKGRGFIQLTGRANYFTHGHAIGLGSQLVDNPDLANDPDIAGRLLASFLKAHEDRIRTAIGSNDLAAARKLVNGGSHGLEVFEESFGFAGAILPDQIDVLPPSPTNG